jgi:hypothetical protein
MAFWPSEEGLHPDNSGLLSDIVYDVAFDNDKGLAYLATDKGISILQIPFADNPSKKQSMYISPNPFIIPDDDWVIIKNIPSGSIIKIMTITGSLIKEINLPSNKSQAIWDGTNTRGDRVGTAVYLVSAHHPSERNKVSKIADKAFNCYRKISEELDVEMHSMESAQRRIEELRKGKERFMQLSRELAHKAQMRESVTVQPKEHLMGVKAMITIKNYLGGYYYFTCDELEIYDNELHLIEGKHTRTGLLPSEGDIKDGLIKMILFTNLENVVVNGYKFYPVPVLKLTTNNKFNEKLLSKSRLNLLNLLRKEAKNNRFRIKINAKFIV